MSRDLPALDVRVDRFMYNAEDTLSKIAAIPVIGTVAGLTKVIMGTAQTVSAVALVIFTAIPAIFSEGAKKTCFFGARHILHGLGNVVAGSFEAIPFVGTAIYFVHHIAGKEPSKPGLYEKTGQEKKFLGYSTLANADGSETLVDDLGELEWYQEAEIYHFSGQEGEFFPLRMRFYDNGKEEIAQDVVSLETPKNETLRYSYLGPFLNV